MRPTWAVLTACMSQKPSKLSRFETMKGCKVDPKCVLSDCARGPTGVLKHMFLARFVGVLGYSDTGYVTKIKVGQNVFSQLCCGTCRGAKPHVFSPFLGYLDTLYFPKNVWKGQTCTSMCHINTWWGKGTRKWLGMRPKLAPKIAYKGAKLCRNTKKMPSSTWS